MSFGEDVVELVHNSRSDLVAAAPWWERVHQGEIASILNGYPWKSSFFNERAGFPLIRIRDVTSGKSETYYRGPVEQGFWVEPGDLLVGMDGDFNCVIWASERGLLNQRVCKITPDERLYLKSFLGRVLPGYLKLINDATHSITVKHLSSKTLAQVPLPLPPMGEQRRIVAKIDSLSAKSKRARDRLDHVPRLVEQYRQAILSAACDGSLTQEWRAKRAAPEPKPRGLLALLSTPVRNGLSIRGSDSPPGVRSLRLSALRTHTVDMDDVRFLPINPDRAQLFLLEQGDVLVSRSNGTKQFVGIASLVPSVNDLTIFPDTAFRLRLNPAVALPDWFALVWNAPQARRQIEQVAKTTAGIWKVSQGDLAKIELLVPCVDEQRQTLKRASSALQWIDRLAAEATSARKLIDCLDQAVLAKAFRGDLVPQDSADEPASVLLERIRAEKAGSTVVQKSRGRPRALALL